MAPKLGIIYMKPKHEPGADMLCRYDLTVEVASREMTELPPAIAERVASVHMPYSTPALGRLNYAAVDNEFRHISLQIIENAMRQAAELLPNVGLIVIHGSPQRFVCESQAGGEIGDYELYIQSLRRLADTAAENGLRLMLENNRRYWTNAAGEMAWEDSAPAENFVYFAIEPDHWLQSYHDVGHENMKLCLDTAHACCTVHAIADHDERVEQLMRFLSDPEAIGYVHWNGHELFEPEGRLDKHLNVGKGTIPIEVHRMVKNLGIPLLLEHFHGEEALVEERAYIDSL